MWINSLQILHHFLNTTASCKHHKTKIAWMQLHLSVDAALQLHEERNSIDLINGGWSLKLANSIFVLCTSRVSVVGKISDEKFMTLFFCVLLALCRLAAGKVAKGVKEKHEWMKNFLSQNPHSIFHTNKFECKMLLYAPARLVWERQKKAFKIHFQAQLMRHRVAIILSSCSPWNFMERAKTKICR